MPTERGLGEFFFPRGDFRSKALLALIRHQWFIHMRWIFVIVILALLLLERGLNGEFVRPRAVWLCMVMLAAVNMIWVSIRRGLLREVAAADVELSRVIDRVTWFVNAQMVVDLVILTTILRYTGGLENPMVIFYLFHMLIAAMLLRPVNALLQGAWGAGIVLRPGDW